MMTFWRAVLAPFGVPAEDTGSPMLAETAAITFDGPIPLRAITDGRPELIGSVNLLTRDAGRDPALLLAAGTINTRRSVVDQLANDGPRPVFELADLAGDTAVVTAGRLTGITVLFETGGKRYSAWRSVTRFELSRTRVELADLLGDLS